MAVKFKFHCSDVNNDYLEIESISHCKKISIDGECSGEDICFLFDIPTAIKFAKTLRTAINEVKKSDHE